MASDVAAIIPAAGSGTRLGSKIPKPFVKIKNIPIIIHSLRSLIKSARFAVVYVAVAPKLRNKFEALFKLYGLKGVRLIKGGATRAESVRNAVLELGVEIKWVVIHDAARPFITKSDLTRLTQAARKTGAAILVSPVAATVKKVDGMGRILSTEDRGALRLALTPQMFDRKKLMARYALLGPSALKATDEAMLFDGCGARIETVIGSANNIKITTPADLEYAKFCLEGKA